MIREVSICKHSGFKMHRDKKKIDISFSKDDFWCRYNKIVLKNINALDDFMTSSRNQKGSVRVIEGDSRLLQESLKKESVDLIITSPPYGDSRTTVAYGQFSRLSSQFLGLSVSEDHKISQLDNLLLGGKYKSFQV